MGWVHIKMLSDALFVKDMYMLHLALWEKAYIISICRMDKTIVLIHVMCKLALSFINCIFPGFTDWNIACITVVTY